MSHLPVIDGIGFAAASLVLATFCMRSMSALRWVAIASNLLSSHTAISEISRRCWCFMRCCCRSTPTGWRNCTDDRSARAISLRPVCGPGQPQATRAHTPCSQGNNR